MIELIDAVPLFEHGEVDRVSNIDDTFGLLVAHLRQLVYPELEGEQEDKEIKEARLELVQTLLLNKRTEQRSKCTLESSLDDNIIEAVATEAH